MNPDSVCFLCLATGSPVRDITDSPLREIYQKLMDIPLQTWDSLVAACYICHSQLRNCHALMTRAMTAYTLLMQIKQSGGMINRKSIATIDRQAYKLNDRRSITVSDFINITDPKEGKSKSKHDALCQNFEFESNTLLDVANIKQEMSEESDGEIQSKDEELSYQNIEFKSKTLLDIKFNEHEVSEELKDVDNSILANRRDLSREVTERAEHVVNEGLTSGSNLDHTSIKSSKFECERGADGSGRYNKIFKENIKHEILECEDVDVLTDERVIDHDIPADVADNEYDSLIHTEDMKIEYSKDGTASAQQCEDKTYSETKEKMLISKYNADTKEYAKKAKLAAKNEHVDEDDSHSDVKNDNDYKRTHIKFICDCCGVKFDNKYHLIQHVKWDKMDKGVTKKQKQIKNTLNKKSEVNKIKLKLHSRMHTSERPFKCTTCQFRFKNKGNLIQHIKIHTEEKEFECPICHRRFRHKMNLAGHLSTHYKPLDCELCPSRFIQKRGLSMHIKRAHIDKGTVRKSIECTSCRCIFERISDSNTDLEKQTSECPNCEGRFSIKKDFSKDVRTYARKKSFECTICKQIFSDKNTLNVHLTTHKPYESNESLDSSPVQFACL